MTLEVDDAALIRSLLLDRSGWFSDDTVGTFESEFARWNGSREAFAFMGGRVALSACIHALGLQAGDEVIIPGYTCIVVPNAFAYAGIKLVHADIELDTYGLDIEAVARAITPKTRTIMLHHLYGLVCRDYEAIIALARSKGLAVIEDCAHATGAEYKGIKVGNRGDVGFYSCEHSKIINTGQGGIAVTNDPVIASRLRAYWQAAPQPDEPWIERQLTTLLYNYYKCAHPQRWMLGDVAELLYRRRVLISTTPEEERGIKPLHYGRRMPGAIAAIGRKQLAKVDRFNARRRQTAMHWEAWCDETGHRKPLTVAESVPVFLRYPVLASPQWKRDISMTARRLNTPLGMWFVSNHHPVPVTIANCPNASEAVARCINFPTLMG